MESWQEYMAVGLQYVKILVDASMIGIFFRPFLNNAKKAKWIFFAYIAAMSIIFPIPWDGWVIQPTAIGVIVVLVVSGLMEKRNIWQKVFLSVTAYLMIWISNGLSLLPWNGMWKLWETAAKSSEVIDSANATLILNALYVIINTLNVVFIAALMYVLIRIVHRAYSEKHRILERKELLLLLSPYLSIISGYYMVRFMMQIYKNDVSQYAWDSHADFYVLLMIFQVMSFLTILAEITIYGKIKQTQDEELSRKLLSGQVNDLKGHISEVESLYRGIRGMKHDLNNHIQMLQDLYEKGEYAQAKDYLADLRADYSDVELDVNTGNPITDIIIMQKQKDAGTRGISLLQHFSFPDHGSISAYDVSIILNNILANAIEAAAGSADKRISIRSRVKDEIYYIEVTNSFDGILMIDEGTGLPETTKQDTEGHGLGLQNVKRAAEKYFGKVHIEQEGKEVVLSVILVIPA